ncbi:MAG: 2-dehydro-3-deoxyphosphooctonate aldolase [Parvibaculaceae bacterium]
MRILTLLLILVAVAAAAGYVAYETFTDRSIAEARRTLPTRLQARGLSQGQPVFLRIFKQEAVLELWMRGDEGWRLFQSYPICRFSGQLGPKLKQGDRQAPEGFYQVASGQLNPNSRHHLSFNLGFPNEYDRAHGRTGSFLMVHGGCSSSGCYAMTDPAVDDIYGLVSAALRNGQHTVDVHAFPFRMTDLNMARNAQSRWIDFWRDLKAGYDQFQKGRRVPAVKIADKRYVVEG